MNGIEEHLPSGQIDAVTVVKGVAEILRAIDPHISTQLGRLILSDPLEAQQQIDQLTDATEEITSIFNSWSAVTDRGTDMLTSQAILEERELNEEEVAIPTTSIKDESETVATTAEDLTPPTEHQRPEPTDMVGWANRFAAEITSSGAAMNIGRMTRVISGGERLDPEQFHALCQELNNNPGIWRRGSMYYPQRGGRVYTSATPAEIVRRVVDERTNGQHRPSAEEIQKIAASYPDSIVRVRVRGKPAS